MFALICHIVEFHLYRFLVALIPIALALIAFVWVRYDVRRNSPDKYLGKPKFLERLFSHSNNAVENISSSRFVMFLFAVTAIVLALCITSLWIYFSLMEKTLELKEITQIFYVLALGSTPYAVNRLAEAFEKGNDQANNKK